MKLLSGKLLAQTILDDLKVQVSLLEKTPVLSVILIGDDAKSLQYVEKKKEAGQFIGAELRLLQFHQDVDLPTLIYAIHELNKDKNVDGILVQMPLPKEIDREKIIWAIDSQKDVDGFQMNLYRPPAPMGILELLQHYKISVLRKKVTIVGYGFLIGKPLGILLRKQGAFVTTVEKGERDFKSKIAEAEIVISATGQKHLITEELVSSTQVIVDAGGDDVDFEKVKLKVKWITPPIGGIGPMTVAVLMRNLVSATKMNQNE